MADTKYVTNFQIEDEYIYVRDDESRTAIAELEESTTEALENLENEISMSLMKGTMNSSLLFRDFQENTNIVASQGMAYVSDDCILQFFRNDDDDFNYIYKYNIDGELLDTGSVSIGHCNGACYDEVNDVVIVSGSSDVPFYAIDYDSLSIKTTDVIPDIDSYTGNIAYDRVTKMLYTAKRDNDNETITIYTVDPSNDYAVTNTVEDIPFPALHSLLNSTYYTFVTQGSCAFNGNFGMVLWRPNLFVFFDAETGEHTSTININEISGYGIPTAEIEDAEILEDGTAIITFNAPMNEMTRCIFAKSNVVTNENFGGYRTISTLGLSLYLALGDNSRGYADGSEAYPFRYAQEACEVAMVNNIATAFIVVSQDTSLNYGEVNLRSCVRNLTIGSTSYDTIELGDVHLQDSVVRLANCNIVPSGNFSYPVWVTGNSVVTFDNFDFEDGTVAGSYYGYITGGAQLYLTSCNFNYDPSDLGNWYISNIGGLTSRGSEFQESGTYFYGNNAFVYWYTEEPTLRFTGTFKMIGQGVNLVQYADSAAYSAGDTIDLDMHGRWHDHYSQLTLLISTQGGYETVIFDNIHSFSSRTFSVSNITSSGEIQHRVATVTLDADEGTIYFDSIVRFNVDEDGTVEWGGSPTLTIAQVIGRMC